MSISSGLEGCSKGSIQQGWNSLRKPIWSSLGMLSITHDKGDSHSDGSDDLKFRQGKQQLLHIKKCKNAEKTQTVCSRRKKTPSIWRMGNWFLFPQQSSFCWGTCNLFDLPLQQSEKLAKCKFMISSSLQTPLHILTKNNPTPISALLPGHKETVLSLYVACCRLVHIWHTEKKSQSRPPKCAFNSFHVCCLGTFIRTFMSQRAKLNIYLPHSANHTFSQVIQKILISSYAQQAQSTTVHKSSHSMSRVNETAVIQLTQGPLLTPL